MFGSIGFPEIIMIFLVVLLLFGPKKLPDFAKMFGKTIKEFRKTINDAKATIEEEIEKVDISKDFKEIEQDIKKIARFETDDDVSSDIYKDTADSTGPAPVYRSVENTTTLDDYTKDNTKDNGNSPDTAETESPSTENKHVDAVDTTSTKAETDNQKTESDAKQ